ncbi:MAG TPA: VOC family protein [Coriobacteriia bacterium]|nr:VOC family protein [Coriobacteriia bacterium]
MANVVVWVDIPVEDLTRARAFYAKLLQNPVDEFPGQEGRMALLMQVGTGEPDDVSADLTTEAITRPSSTHGPVVYLSAQGDIDGMLERAVEAGGQIHAPKQDFGEMGGWLAWIIDSEGNLIGLQQPSV